MADEERTPIGPPDDEGEDDLPVESPLAPERITSQSASARSANLPDVEPEESVEDEGVHGGEVVGSGIGDAQLVEEARRGDGEAFGELVKRYERRLLRVIGRFVSDREQARDLAQETFLRVYEKLESFDTSRRFGPWLFRIGVNRTLDSLRRQKRRGRWALFSESPHERGPDPAVDDPRPDIDMQQEVATILEQIPEKYRMVLVLRDLENFPTSEIAAITGRKEATIRWRLAEARNRFRKLWTKRQGDTDSDPSSEEEGDDDAG